MRRGAAHRSFVSLRPTSVMGIFGTVVEGVAISTAFAGVRRATGFSIKEFAAARIKNERLRSLSNSYFNVGEYVFDKGVDWAVKYKKAEDLRKTFSAAPSQDKLSDRDLKMSQSGDSLNVPKYNADSADAQRKKLEKELEDVYKKK